MKALRRNKVYRVRLEAISPVHIGSGEEILANYGYIYFPEERKIAVIDDAKLLSVIGEENFHHWLANLEKGVDMAIYLNDIRKLTVRAEDIALRVIHVDEHAPVFKELSNQVIREQLHTGTGIPYLAGSSIKGAIRTALLSTTIKNDPDIDDFFTKNKTIRKRGRRQETRIDVVQNLVDFRGNYNDRTIQQRYFGNHPNEDIFRLLRVGDAHFEKNSTTSVFSKSANKHFGKWKFENRFNQFVECIPSAASTHLNIQFDDILHQYSKDRKYQVNDRSGNRHAVFKNKNTSALELYQLFDTINAYTDEYLAREFDIWNEEWNTHKIIGQYLDFLEDVIQIEVNQADKNTCILRLGWATGFNNITGGWQKHKMEKDHYENLVGLLRPNKPQHLLYPKTRRMTADGIPLGFVKLTIEN